MRKLINIITCSLIVVLLAGCSNSTDDNTKENTGGDTTVTTKARTVITTDGEVDDMNSVIRYMYYANEMDLEGIVLTSSVYHYAGDEEKGIEAFRWTGTEWLTEFINAYEEIYPNLSVHAEGYPSPDYLTSVTHIGNITNAGEMEEITDGSEFLKELFLDTSDERALYVQTWGGTNTTARALKSIEEEYSSKDNWEDLKAQISEKLVIYIILNQDETYDNYIAENWPDISIINDVSNFWHFAYAWQYHSVELNTYLQGEWNYENIKNNHGALLEHYALMGDGNMIEGELDEEQRGSDDYLVNNPNYNLYDFISEGDSPSFFYLINNGLRSLEDPTYGGWGSRFLAKSSSLYTNEVLDYNPYSGQFEASYTLTRWFDDIQNDFAARADWGITSNYEDANHNPTVSVSEGTDITAKAGEVVTLNAVASDPDGDELTYRWWRYFEADTYEDSSVEKNQVEVLDVGIQLDIIRELAEGEEIDTIALENADTSAVTLTVPDDAKKGDTIHIIIEVQDNGVHGLKAYQRVIVTVE